MVSRELTEPRTKSDTQTSYRPPTGARTGGVGLASRVQDASVQCEVGDWRARTWGTGLPMAMHLEFVVLGSPISNQQSTPNGKANLTLWHATIAGAARPLWANPLLMAHLKAIIINFYAGNKLMS